MGSLRQYVSIDEVRKHNSAVSQSELETAEQIIDAYVGFIQKAVSSEYTGEATGGTDTTLIDVSTDSPLSGNDGEWTYTVVEFLSGANMGERRFVNGFASATKTCTFDSKLANAVESGDVYRIYQVGKFPRSGDYSIVNNKEYYHIIQEVREAVIVQADFVNKKGMDYFNANMSAESIGDYSYTKATGQNTIDSFVSPLAKEYLNGIVSKVGYL